MKIRGFMAVLLLTVVIVYFIWFAKSGEKTNIKAEVDQFSRTKVILTETNLSSLEKIVAGYMGEKGSAPADLREIQRAQIVTAGLVDGWGRNIKYERLPDDHFRLTSAGADGEFGTEDDIIREY